MNQDPSDKFFRAVLAAYSPPPDLQLLVVTHLVPGIENFLRTADACVPIAAVIPKPSSVDPRVLAGLAQQFAILSYTREDIAHDPARFINAFSPYLRLRRLAVIDTGAYMAGALDALQALPNTRLAGIVEDTENGHQRYARRCRAPGSLRPAVPLLSVARSPLKQPEDFLVGQAIVFSAEAVLRGCGELLSGKCAAVLGFGKIGSGIAAALSSKGVRVNVSDLDPCRQVMARAHGYHCAPLVDCLRESQLVFCATGNRALSASSLRAIRPDAYVFCATSGDDEIEDFDTLLEAAVHCPRTHVTPVHIADTRFFLCNRGQAVNFLHGGVVGPFIRLVQAEMLAALSCLAHASPGSLETVPDAVRRTIAACWLDSFPGRV